MHKEWELKKENKYSMSNVSLVKEVQASNRIFKKSSVFTRDDLRLRILESLESFLDSYLRDMDIKNPTFSIGDLEEFEMISRQNLARKGKGATQYNSLLWLFVFCRCLKPEVIVESGVYIGRSLWIIRKASPNSKLYAFDTNLDNLKFKDKSIALKEMDWSQSDVMAEGENDLCYFDDHINNCLRIRQAYEKGFRNLIFDDSPSIMNLHHFRFPGIPTAQMLLDDNLQEGDSILWKWKDKVFQYIHSENYVHNVRDLIESIVVLPDLEKYTGQKGSNHFVFVRLKRNNIL